MHQSQPPNILRLVSHDPDSEYDLKSHEQFKHKAHPSPIPENCINLGDDEVTMRVNMSGPRWKIYSIIILIFMFASILLFAYAIVQYQIKDHHIEAIEYTLAETVANAFIIIFTIYIYIFYIYLYESRGNGRIENSDCTNFDVYAIFSLLWFLMSGLLYLTYGDAVYGLFSIVRMVSIIAPGFIHQTYIRLNINLEFRSQHFIYLGDIAIYKICCIIFLSFQLFSNVIQLPLNTAFFQDSISDIFHLDDESDVFHFPFIIASVFGRPFVSILNFHLLILYITWLVNGDKPMTHHNLDLFALTMGDSRLNVVFGAIVMVLYIIDIIFSHYIYYRSVVLCIYFVFSLYHFYFLLIEAHKTHRLRTNTNELKESDANIDVFTIFESSFVLIGGVLACLFYIGNIDDIYNSFDAFSELAAWSLFIISQYIFVLFIQFDYVFGRKLLMRRRTQKVLSCSALISAVSITFLFSFEYVHFVDHLTHHHHDDNIEVTLTISYSLFWCLIEYFIWSFVAINHMLHHVHNIQHIEKIEEINEIIINEMQQQLQSPISPFSPSEAYRKAYRHSLSVQWPASRSRKATLLFVNSSPRHDNLYK